LHEALIIAVEEVIPKLKGGDKEILRKVSIDISHCETLPPWETWVLHATRLCFGFSIGKKLLIDKFMSL